MSGKIPNSLISCVLFLLVLETVLGDSNFLKNNQFDSIDCPAEDFLYGYNHECDGYFSSAWRAVSNLNPVLSDFKARFVTASSIQPLAQEQRVVALHKYDSSQNKQKYCVRQTFDRLPYGNYNIKINYIAGHSQNFQTNQAKIGVHLYSNDQVDAPFQIQMDDSVALSEAGEHSIQFQFSNDRTYKVVIFFICDQTPVEFTGYTIGLKKVTFERVGDNCQLGQYSVWLNDQSIACKALSSISQTEFRTNNQCKVWQKDSPNDCYSHIEYCGIMTKVDYFTSTGILRSRYQCTQCFSFAQTLDINKAQCVIKPASQLIPHCTTLVPGTINLCQTCQSIYVPTTQQTSCQDVLTTINCVTQQGFFPIRAQQHGDGVITPACILQDRLIKNCYIYHPIQGMYECKTCVEGFGVINVMVNGKMRTQCVYSSRIVQNCDVHVQFLNTCLYKCESCVAGRQLGNVKVGSRIVQNCLSLANQFLPDCNLYHQDNGVYYCQPGHCSASSVQIPIGTTSKQLACTTFPLLDGSNGKGECQIYQRPTPVDTSLKCSQCKDPSKQLPYCS